jgi:hypothetical protein
VQLRREAALEVVHALLVVVHRELVRDALQGGGRLHHGHREHEALQVVDEAAVRVLEN